MKIYQAKTYLSASDLSTHIACPHATSLNLLEATGELVAPVNIFGSLKALQQKGEEFEDDYIGELRKSERKIVEIDSTDRRKALRDTLNAMADGADIIYQARLEHDIWNGWADFLIKVGKPSTFGNWSYEVMDTKLSRETKAGAILQICLYSEILNEMQGCLPEFMYINNPNGEQQFRVSDFMAYYRLMKRRLLQSISGDNAGTYPEAVPHCDICKWWQICNERRRKDDHLSFVAGIQKLQILEVRNWEVTTLASMAALHPDISQKPNKGSITTYRKLAYQASLQWKQRETGKPVFEILPLEEGFGFFKLPEPSDHDIFFDFEGDPFYGTNGLEYLFGWYHQGNYHELWAGNEKEEKESLQTFIELVMKIQEEDPGMHIYHYGAYEQTALKRLVGKYATKEDELDLWLRGQVFVNLHGVVRRSIIAGVERYSLKDLEKLHGYLRSADLRDVGPHKLRYEGLLESGNIEVVDEETRNIVREYNKDDCISTQYLRDWLERERAKLVGEGENISRPPLVESAPSEKITIHQERIQPLYDALMVNVPETKDERTPGQQAKWLLANMLDWYRREKKSFWWEVFRLRDLTDEELLEEKDALSGLVYTDKREKEKRSFVDYYTFPEQETTLSDGNIVQYQSENIGTIHFIDFAKNEIGIKKYKEKLDIHPTSLLCSEEIPDKPKEEAIIRLAEWVINNGIDAEGNCRAGRDLLLRNLPRTNGEYANATPAMEQAINWARRLDRSVLPIQGPPGTGKSYTAARMIIALIKEGKKIGVSALSHKVINALLEKIKEAAARKNTEVRIAQKVRSGEEEDTSDQHHLLLTKNVNVLNNLDAGYHVAAGTSFMWANADFFEKVDYLFVDEAGQLSLIDTLALSHAGKNLVLLGDPQQLQQPQKGTHPDGTEASALKHILQDSKTISPDHGVFLDKTWRMHPAINDFISELFYEGRLEPMPQNHHQQIKGKTKYSKPGLYFEPVVHAGNQNSSLEEVERVAELIKALLSSGSYFVNTSGEQESLTEGHIKIISPYNAQVNALQEMLPELQIGTVDKFQGQEAPIIILSMASSSQEDAPRGMEFLYSLNRLNVAVSRAKAVFILVASPALLEPECRSPYQIKLANALCRFSEMVV
ncbi:TM0106 family RecB-like putative nuclease [soil metagenome]